LKELKADSNVSLVLLEHIVLDSMSIDYVVIVLLNRILSQLVGQNYNTVCNRAHTSPQVIFFEGVSLHVHDLLLEFLVSEDKAHHLRGRFVLHYYGVYVDYAMV